MKICASKILRTSAGASGFTLIELLIVMAILGVLAAFIGPTLWGKVGESRQTAAKAQMTTFETALDTYRLDVGRYPESLDGLVENDTGRDSWGGPYIKEIPLDPWGNPYHYEGESREYELMSYGADGVPGGQEDDEDIES